MSGGLTRSHFERFRSVAANACEPMVQIDALQGNG
jgi:hypothetical protein